MPVSGLDPSARAAIVIGLLLVVLAAVWRWVSLWLARVRLSKALASPDPATRCSAIAVATSQGVARHVRVLTKLREFERNEDVLETLAQAVRQHLWEPADSQAMVELRLWAEGRRRSRTAGRTEPSAPKTVAPSTTEPHSARWALALADGDIYTVIVTGAGGPAGVNVIRALRTAGHHVIGVDADPLAAGLHLASGAEIVSPADDPGFVDQLLDIAAEHEADALITTIVEEMVVLADRYDEVVGTIAAWIPDGEVLELCNDKWRFANAMTVAGVCVPQTALPGGADIPGPWIVKPRSARGSRGLRYADDHAQLADALRCLDDAIVQTRVSGHEFTVDALVDRDGEVVGAVPRWRLETKAGISTKGRTFHDDRVIDGVTSVLGAIGLRGAANVQGFVDGDDVTFIEVNPRFSGGLSLSLAAGADLVGEYLRGVLRMPIRPEHLEFRPDTTMIRHFEEIYT
jgi:carbamoyl-phosphate synthase large subunit